jgi:Modulator of levamisole receptor-1
MGRIAQLCGLLFKILLAVALWQRSVISSVSTSWIPDTYPNPTIDLDKCGRKGVRSWICDPDGVLSYISANVVEGTLIEIAAAVDPFASSGCKKVSPAGVKGYQARYPLDSI